MAAERERMQECEVKRRRVKAGGGYEPFWKVKSVTVALQDADTEFRCKDCNGAVKIFKPAKATGIAHAEHKERADAEYCSGGLLFSKATDGREHRMAAHIVD